MSADINNELDRPLDFSAFDYPASSGAEETREAPDESKYLRLADEIFSDSTDYFDTNIAPTWETNLAHFRSEHAASSKYQKAGYKRSKIFRPKTRSSLRALEASMAVAAFSTQDLMAVSPENPLDPASVANAEINKALLQYRLEKTVPWFLTVMGAFQDANVYGVAIAHTYWDIERSIDYAPAMDETGNVMVDEEGNLLGEEVVTLEKDQPAIDLVPPENFRFSPMADWRDPAGTSPYIVHIIPMTLGDIRARMDAGDFRTYSDAQVMTAKGSSYDSVRSEREGRNREDPVEEGRGDFTTINVHRNIVRDNGRDIHYLTLGTQYLLTTPTPLREVYPHLRRGERPYVVGYTTIEAHRNYPDSVTALTAPLQTELNEITNQRLDNVKLVLNKRYHVRRGANVDLQALMRNTPGGGVMMANPKDDVVVVNTPDVTSSSYAEQDRIAVEHDELIGNFSQGSVLNNRKLNETVGGMQMMSGGANATQDYTIRIFVETFLEKVLRQLSRLESYYETDATVLALAGEAAQLRQKFGIDTATDEILLSELNITVNIGMGMTDPMKRVERLMFGISQVLQLPTSADRIKSDEVETEIFGALGYKNGSRFFEPMEDFKARMAEQPPQEDPMIAVKRETNQVTAARDQAVAELHKYQVDRDFEARMIKLAEDRNLRLEELAQSQGIEMERIRTDRQSKALEATLRNSEMALRLQTGAGI